ncbi:MAG TPA: glycosyltransferase [Acidimicrobiales bacterium]|nr:glycosyltransferase [Acidimicrobiales bacterium]
MRVDQYLPSFAPYDAIGAHALQVRKALRLAGYRSEIWAAEIHGALRAQARPFGEDLERCRERLLLYQCSTSSPLANWLAARAKAGEPLLSQYHNITPPRYFERWDRSAARAMEQARDELAALASAVGLAMAVSVFNERELTECGYLRTAVCPLLVDLEAYHRPPRSSTLERLRRRKARSGAQWLFVGRFVPNKCQHDVIAAFAAYRYVFDHRARLTLAGWGGQPRYRSALERLARQLELGESVELVEGADEADLLAYWEVSDVFVCMSEHEGFCVPVLEAMELGVPVVAYSAAAVPETLGEAGVLLEDKKPIAVARAVHEVCTTGARERLVAAGRARAAGYSLANSSRRFLSILAEFSQ